MTPDAWIPVVLAIGAQTAVVAHYLGRMSAKLDGAVDRIGRVEARVTTIERRG